MPQNDWGLIGTVQSTTDTHAIVQVGDNVTPPIRWSTRAAGTVNEQRRPSDGEQVVMLNCGSPNSWEGMIIICSLHSPTYPAPNSSPDSITLDAGGFTSKITTDGDRTITGVNFTQTSSKESFKTGAYTIKADNFIVNALTNIKKSLTAAAATFSASVSIEGISFKSHTHKENDNKGQTGGAQ